MFAFQRLTLPAIQRVGKRGARLQAPREPGTFFRWALWPLLLVGSIECWLLLLLKFLANFCFYQKKSLPV